MILENSTPFELFDLTASPMLTHRRSESSGSILLQEFFTMVSLSGNNFNPLGTERQGTVITA
jgi:hypothetical protein